MSELDTEENNFSKLAIILGLLFICLVAKYTSIIITDKQATNHGEDDNSSNARYQVVTWEFNHVRYPFIIAIWLLSACYMKIIFNIWPQVSHHFPDSSLLIVTGLMFGVFTRLMGDNINDTASSLSPNFFFLCLLPPIVFEAAYFMPKRAFFDNFGAIMLFAVVGTLWNTFAIGGSLFGVSKLFPTWFDLHPDIMHIMLFAAIVSAVDPVAVLVVFDEMGVNEALHITVFGESLLNDAVTVVLYKIFSAFVKMGAGNVETVDYVAGVGSFFVVSLGGITIGALFGILVAVSTKYTRHVKVVSPVLCLVIPYLAYLSAGAVSLSEILSICTCGLVMKDYVKENISFKAQVTLTKMCQMLASSSETILFFFLGLSVVNNVHKLNFDIPFILCTLFFCIVYRAIGVFTMTAFLNRYRTVKFTVYEQVIMVYGGLRGAVAYGLAMSMPNTETFEKDTYLATTVVVILFTVFVQGITIKPLVTWLQIKLKETDEKTVNQMINERLLDHTCAGIDLICGFNGQHSFRNKFEHFNTKYIKSALTVKSQFSSDMRIVRAAESLVTKEAIVAVQKRLSRKLSIIDNTGVPPYRRMARDHSSKHRKLAAVPEGIAPVDTQISMDSGIGHSHSHDEDPPGRGVNNLAFVNEDVFVTINDEYGEGLAPRVRVGSNHERSESADISEVDVKHWLHDTEAIRVMKRRHSVAYNAYKGK